MRNSQAGPQFTNVLVMNGPKSLGYISQELKPLGSDGVRIRTEYATIKHGTEMNSYFGRTPFANKTFNTDLRIFEQSCSDSVMPHYPRPVGNMVVGIVMEVGSSVEKFKVGDCVFAWAPISDELILREEHVRAMGRLTPEQAVLVDPATFALGAVLDGDVTSEDSVLVTGLGAIGLLVVQYCKSRGAKVIAVSSFKKRRALARAFGANTVYDSAAITDLGLTVKRDHGGVTVAIECSGSIEKLHQAIRSTAQCGRVVCVGFYGPANEKLNLGEEFFHNRISLLASLPAFTWNNPVRGDKALRAADLQRQAAADLVNGAIVSDGMLEPVLPLHSAQEAVDLIASSPASVVKVMLYSDHVGRPTLARGASGPGSLDAGVSSNCD